MRQSHQTKLSLYLKLMRFDKPIGTFLLLWPTLWALWLAAQGTPSLLLLFVFIAGTVIMRAAGCVINDIADRRFDRHVSRTKERPLANGSLSVRSAWIIFFILLGSAFLLVLLLNRLTLFIAIFAAVVAMIYPLMKRVTHLPQFVLGIAFSAGIPMAYAATLGYIPSSCWVVVFANYCWIIAYDTMYALTDRQDDLLIGVKSTAILFGEYDRIIIGVLQLLALSTLMIFGIGLHLAWPYYLGIGGAALFALYQQRLIAKRDPQRCFKAFLNNHWFGLAVFAGILLAFIAQ